MISSHVFFVGEKHQPAIRHKAGGVVEIHASVNASESEAIHLSCAEPWIASSLRFSQLCMFTNSLIGSL
jgi:hypothetical protein